MGIEHTMLTFQHNGRAERATVNEGHVVTQVLA
jgi:hypothetical protein